MEVINTLGRRKKSIARIYLTKGTGTYTINGKDYREYFPTVALQYRINQPFTLTDNVDQYDLKANVTGGGITGQAEAVRLALSRAFVQIDADNKPALKAEGLMTRDPRMVERKKPGQKKARKKFQFSKR
jgi:small subunit ribosomal protein S9